MLYINRAGRNNAGRFKIDSGLEAFHILFKSCLCIYRLYILQLSLILFVHFWHISLSFCEIEKFRDVVLVVCFGTVFNTVCLFLVDFFAFL